MSSINDDLMSGGKLQAALFSTDASGNVTGLVGPDGTRYAAPLPSGDESGVVDTANLNIALARGGFVGLLTPGDYFINDSLVIPSDTEFYLTAGVKINAVAGRNYPVIRNKYDGYIHSANKFSRASNVVTVADARHFFNIGDVVWVGGGPDSSYNGLATVTSVNASGWSYANNGEDDPQGGASGEYFNIIPIRRTIAGTAVICDTGTLAGQITVTDPGHTFHPGDQVYAIKAGSTLCHGLVDITEVSENTWSYYITGSTGSETGVVGLSYDQNISITGGGVFEGNRAGLGAPTGGDGLRSAVVGHFGNVSGIVLDSAFNGSPMRGAALNNCVNVLIDNQFHSEDVLVAVQFEGGARNVLVDVARVFSSQMHSATNQKSDDLVAFTGTKYAAGAPGNYDNVISPYGLRYFQGLDVRRLVSTNCLNAIKFTSHADCPFRGNTHVGRVTVLGGTVDGYHLPGNLIRYMDDGPGLVGTSMDGLIIDGPVDWSSVQNVGGIASISGSGSIGKMDLRCGKVQNAASSFVSVSQTVTIGALTIRDSVIPYYGVNNPACNFSGGTVNKMLVRDCEITAGQSGPFIYLNGATVKNIEFRDIVLKAYSANVGTLLDYSIAATLNNLTYNGVTTDPSASVWPASLFQIANINVGTLDLTIDNCNYKSASGFTTPSTGTTGTVNVYLGSVKWAATGGNNFCQVGGGTWNLYGGSGVQVANDKLVLFGYGAPTYRISVASANAKVNLNSGSYTTGLSPVDGDVLYNHNAGVIPVGFALRRSGAWGAL